MEPQEVCCIHTHSGITVTPRVIPGQDPTVTPAGNKSEPAPRNTLGTRLKPAQLPRCSQFGGCLLSQLVLRIRELGKFCWRPSLYPAQLNIWSGRAGAVSASSRCSGSLHILIAHTPGAGFLLSYVNCSGPVPAPWE